MFKNKELYFLKISFLCSIIILSAIFITRHISMFGVNNTATVLNTSQNNSNVLYQINQYTSQAESLSNKINNKWTLTSTKKSSQIKFNSVLTKRKDLIIDAYKKGITLDSISKLSSASEGIVLNTSLIEKRISIANGEIVTFIVDDFENKKSSFQYKIVSDSKMYDLVLSNSELGYISGKVDLNAIAFGPVLYAEPNSLKINSYRQEKNLSVKNSHNVLVILINTPGSVDVPFTAPEAHNLIFNGQFNNFMKEQSYGKANFTGDVFGWLTVDLSSPNYQTDIDNFVTQNQINVNDYDHLMYIRYFPGIITKAYSTLGPEPIVLGGIYGQISQAYFDFSSANFPLMPSPYASPDVTLPFSWTYLDFVFSHELGHSMGLPHASGIDCGELQINSPCQHNEYGNNFDAMGYGTAFSLHFNGYYKYLLGWINRDEILTISKSAIYTLQPLEAGPAMYSSKKVAFIKLPADQENIIYALEYRAPVGFDSQLEQPDSNKTGLYVYQFATFKEYYDYYDVIVARIIDSQPSELEWDEDTKISFIKYDQPFIDTANGISIHLLAPGLLPFV